MSWYDSTNQSCSCGPSTVAPTHPGRSPKPTVQLGQLASMEQNTKHGTKAGVKTALFLVEIHSTNPPNTAHTSIEMTTMSTQKPHIRSPYLNCSQDTPVCGTLCGLLNSEYSILATAIQSSDDHAGDTRVLPDLEWGTCSTKPQTADSAGEPISRPWDPLNKLPTMIASLKTDDEHPTDQLEAKRKASEISDVGSPAKRAKTQSPPVASGATKVVQFPEKVCGHLSNFRFSDSHSKQPAVVEEREGVIEFRVVNNDGKPESTVILTGLKGIFQKQLPKMPKDYIARLVYDRTHMSLAIVKKPMEVVG
jgi:hypothetical protein